MKIIRARIDSHGDLHNALVELERATSDQHSVEFFRAAPTYTATLTVGRYGSDLYLEAEVGDRITPRFMWEEVDSA